MAVFTKRITVCRCERCEHEWTPRDESKLPKVCPNPACKSPYWNRPRQSDTNKKRAKAAKRNG